jgi:hypothetical protein
MWLRRMNFSKQNRVVKMVTLLQLTRFKAEWD